MYRINVNLEGGGRGLGLESWPMVGTFDYHQVPRMGTFEFPIIVNGVLNWKLQGSVYLGHRYAYFPKCWEDCATSQKKVCVGGYT